GFQGTSPVQHLVLDMLWDSFDLQLVQAEQERNLMRKPRIDPDNLTDRPAILVSFWDREVDRIVTPQALDPFQDIVDRVPHVHAISEIVMWKIYSSILREAESGRNRPVGF